PTGLAAARGLGSGGSGPRRRRLLLGGGLRGRFGRIARSPVGTARLRSLLRPIRCIRGRRRRTRRSRSGAAAQDELAGAAPARGLGPGSTAQCETARGGRARGGGPGLRGGCRGRGIGAGLRHVLDRAGAGGPGFGCRGLVSGIGIRGGTGVGGGAGVRGGTRLGHVGRRGRVGARGRALGPARGHHGLTGRPNSRSPGVLGKDLQAHGPQPIACPTPALPALRGNGLHTSAQTRILGGMRAIQITAHGGPEVLTPVDLDIPEPGPGEVLIRTAAIGVNYIDTYFREGVYSSDLPFVPGSEGVGVVEAVGSGTPDLVPGDRVAWCQAPGSYAQYVVAPAPALVTVPDGVDDRVAASMLLQGRTAHYLITAGAGGVGQLLIQLAVARGYRVITTTSTEEKAARCRELGAHHVLFYAEATAERIRELSDGGVAVVFDGVGADTFDTSLASLRPRGMLVLFGAASGPVPAVEPQRRNSAGSLFLTRPTRAHYIATTEEYRARAAEVMEGLLDGSRRLSVGATFGLSEAAEAQRSLQSRQTTGSVVLGPSR